MPTSIITPDQDAIITEIEINAPAARVFKALTDSKELMAWFNDAKLSGQVLEDGRSPRRPVLLCDEERHGRRERCR